MDRCEDAGYQSRRLQAENVRRSTKVASGLLYPWYVSIYELLEVGYIEETKALM